MSRRLFNQFRPSGNLIACTQRLEDKHNVIFYERNGLRHGEFTLRTELEVLDIKWNTSSDILALLVAYPKTQVHFKNPGLMKINRKREFNCGT